MAEDEGLLKSRLLAAPAALVMGLTIWAEARGEGAHGMAAVGWVIANRALNRRQSIARVCLAPWQFSCWNDGDDANHRTLTALAEQALGGQVEDTALALALRVAAGVMTGTIPDPTRGADHYLTTALYQSEDCPRWATPMPVSTTLRRHTFLRERTDA